jgi:hypothetical protein
MDRQDKLTQTNNISQQENIKTTFFVPCSAVDSKSVLKKKNPHPNIPNKKTV